MSRIGISANGDTGPSVSIILPVLNERGNLAKLLPRLTALSSEINLREVICVDDGSVDGTLEYLREQSDSNFHFDIVVVARSKRLGQVNACIVGAGLAKSEFVAVLDADLQHPPETLVDMYSKIRTGFDVVSASRYVNFAQVTRLPYRGLISRGAMQLTHALLRPSRLLTDPMSGFFLARRNLVAKLVPLSNRCKLLLYILVTHRNVKVAEVPYGFQERTLGKSKTVGPDFSFILNFLIEVITYFKMKDCDTRYISEPQYQLTM